MPPPGPSVANGFTRRLTRLGFGRKYRAEFFHDGQTVLKDFEVTQGPPSFETAPRFKSEPLGLTVRDLTYEARRYFRKEEADPGVVVSKVERGRKAAVAGIRPMEIITHVNDTAVANVATFRKLIEGKGELRLSVTRMTEQRLVKITLPAMEEKTGDGPPASMPP
jgi:S1-C subfamily serine protease